MIDPNMVRFPQPGYESQSEGFRCLECGQWIWTHVVEEIDAEAHICFRQECREKRVRKLLRYERAAKRIAELIQTPRQYKVEPNQLHAEILAVALAAEHWGV